MILLHLDLELLQIYNEMLKNIIGLAQFLSKMLLNSKLHKN